MPSQIDLRGATRKAGRRRPILIPVFDLPPALAGELARILITVPRLWASMARDRILPAYDVALRFSRPIGDGLTLDDIPGLNNEMGAADESAYRLILTLTPELRRWTVKAATMHQTAFVNSVLTASGINLSSILSLNDVDTTVEATIARNVSLVRSVSDDIRRSIAEEVFRGFIARTPRREVAKAMNAAVQLGKARCLRIASDQSTKLSAALDQARQEQVGIVQFIWRHSGKVHYRPHHKARNGKIYGWRRNNLHGDLPGVAINCGCKAQGYIPGVELD